MVPYLFKKIVFGTMSVFVSCLKFTFCMRALLAELILNEPLKLSKKAIRATINRLNKRRPNKAWGGKDRFDARQKRTLAPPKAFIHFPLDGVSIAQDFCLR